MPSAIGITRIRPKSVSVDWPANSPDLNIIENVWADIDYAVQAKNPRNDRQLKRYIKQEWENYPITKIRNMVKSMDARLKEVSDNEGGHTSY